MILLSACIDNRLRVLVEDWDGVITPSAIYVRYAGSPEAKAFEAIGIADRPSEAWTWHLRRRPCTRLEP